MAKRRMVVFPEPDGPIRVTRSPRSTEKFKALRTTLSPKRFCTSRNSMTGCVMAVGSVGVGKFFLQSSDKHGSEVAGNQKDHAGNPNGLDVSICESTDFKRCGRHFHSRAGNAEGGTL